MNRSNPTVAAALAGLLLAGAASAQSDIEALTRQVTEAELRFARSMAERDHEAFAKMLSEQAVFFNGPQVLEGKAAVAAGWKRFFGAKTAPFSWEPDLVVVLADGALAHSTGPVRDPSGKPIARFNSVWRLEAPNTWRVVFDKGETWQEPAKP